MTTKRRIVLGSAIALLALAAFLFTKWRQAGLQGGQKHAEPFRIAGNLYYVGMNDISSFLITGPEGHVLLDGGYPSNDTMIVATIAKLGFRIADVKVILNSEPHLDHGGGIWALQRASGAQVWVSDENAKVFENHNVAVEFPWYARVLQRIFSPPSVHVDRRLRDGDTVRVGPTAIVARVTPGHSPGCTSYSFQVQDTVKSGAADSVRALNVVSACSLVQLGVAHYPTQAQDFEYTFATLRALPADIWFTSHGRAWGRYRKFARRDSLASPADAFIDRAGYRAYIDSGEAEFKRGRVH